MSMLQNLRRAIFIEGAETVPLRSSDDCIHDCLQNKHGDCCLEVVLTSVRPQLQLHLYSRIVFITIRMSQQQPSSWTHEDIEAQIREIQAKAKAVNGDENAGVSLTASVMDSAIYGASDKFADYVTSIGANDDEEDDDDDAGAINSNGNTIIKKSRLNVHAPSALLRDVIDEVSFLDCDRFCLKLTYFCLELRDQDHDPMAENRIPRVIDREDEYRRRHRKAVISPERADPFLEGIVLHVSCIFYAHCVDLISYLRTRQAESLHPQSNSCVFHTHVDNNTTWNCDHNGILSMKH